ncbi:hypothetical protein BV133_2661 [Blastochloris viridis]|uniref:PQQ-dependent catabolism-associated beta-propeller protein n=2 Tax=Blastochloris viridis TaxID=1079 RepID=A0A0H5BGI6_BLAVI|nr:hypothetical protein BV133_2661 [Blastochloris viridis]CUU42504.1 PQQ-dependent catabolism-associated beta-propeller protein [Blastochloris viridis]
MRTPLLAALALLITLFASPAAPAWLVAAYIQGYVFVPSAETPAISVIDTDTDRIVGTLHIDIVPRQVEVSRELAKLVATDGRAALSVLNVSGGALKEIVLPNLAQRLVLGSRGRILAAIDLAAGAIALVDLDTDRVRTKIAGLPPLRDVMFANQDTLIFYAAEGLAGIGMIDVMSGEHVGEIVLGAIGTEIATLTRTPSDRQALAQPQGGGTIAVLDLERRQAIDHIEAGPGAGPAVPSGTGRVLLIPEPSRQALVVRSERLVQPVRLRGASVVTGIYTAWLDSVGFVASAALHRLLVYDLDRPSLSGEITLPGTPLRGAVTSDSRKLYLPLMDPPKLMVVDGQSQRVVATIALPSTPLAAIVAGGWGVCH